jgi:hypothetical protein
MKFGILDLKTERQWRAVTGIDRESFFKLLDGFTKSYLETYGEGLKQRLVYTKAGYCINSEEELLLYTLFSLKSGLTYDILGLMSGMGISNAKRNQQTGLAILAKTLETLGNTPKESLVKIKDFESYFAKTKHLIAEL